MEDDDGNDGEGALQRREAVEELDHLVHDGDARAHHTSAEGRFRVIVGGGPRVRRREPSSISPRCRVVLLVRTYPWGDWDVCLWGRRTGRR